MKSILAILRKELNGFFPSLIGYVVIGFFLLIMGLVVWIFPDSNVLDLGYADLQPLFVLGPYILMLLVPSITMGLLAEERKLGTLELLLTSAIKPIQVVWGKYLASLVIMILTLLLTSGYYVAIYYLANPTGNVDTAAILGSYVGLFCLAASFAGIGILASSLTKNQIVAFLLGVLGCFILYQGFDAWSTLQAWKSYALWISQCGFLYHYESLSRGVIDSRAIVYFMSVNILLVAVTSRILLSYQR
jgi:ABC-2 type transport system permease protein